jgi:iron complex transport system substrate-binding protein
VRALLAALLLLAALPALAAQRRVVSLNLCTDQLLVLLAPEKVVALSPLARDPALSTVAAQAAHLPWVRPDAEAVLALAPDLVLAGPYGAQTTLAALANRGLAIERTVMPQDFPAIRAETRRFAALLGAEAAGERLLAAMDRTLAAIPPHPPRLVLPLEARGYAPAADSLEEAVIRAAGFSSAGAGLRLSLEAIAAHPPDLLVTADAPDYPSLATDFLRHPVLQPIARRTWPPALLACGGPWTAQAAALLARDPG